MRDSDPIRFRREPLPPQETAIQAERTLLQERDETRHCADAEILRMRALLNEGRARDAWAVGQQLLGTRPDDFELHNSVGGLALAIGEFQQAAGILFRAIALNDRVARVHLNLGIALEQLKRIPEAFDAFDRAISLKPSMEAAFTGRGRTALVLGRAEEALKDFEEAIARGDLSGGTALQKAAAFRALHRIDESKSTLAAAAARSANDATILHRCGAAFRLLDDPQNALSCFNRAIQLNPNNARFFVSRGELLNAMGRPVEAEDDLARALALDPGYPFLPGMLLHFRMRLCRWQDFDVTLQTLCNGIARGEAVSPPFPLLALYDSLELQSRCAQTWVEKNDQDVHANQALPARRAREKIVVGYFSSNFYDHPVGRQLVGALEQHDRSRFTIIGFSFGPSTGDEIEARLRQAFDRYFAVATLTDEMFAEFARLQDLDIAIDLAGFTGGSRTRVFSYRLAPVQVAWLGYPGPLGAAYIDYLIADKIVVPAPLRDAYPEKILSLPDNYLPESPIRLADFEPITRSAAGLPDTGFIYCCFNNTFKITPPVFKLWMRILVRTGSTYLWLLRDNPAAEENLRQEADKAGVDPERLIFAPRATFSEHIRRHTCADLFLDTAPYNAHSTAVDALWAGVPLLTCPGRAFASRVAASLCYAAGVPDLVVKTWEEYEDRAVALSADGATVQALRRRLLAGRDTCALYDSARFARNLERGLLEAHRRGAAGLRPEHIMVT